MNERNILRERRKSLKFTQRDMERMTGIERTRYNKIEKGVIAKISFIDAYVISKALHANMEYLFEGDIAELTPTGTDHN